MNKRYIVRFTTEEREALEALVKKGKEQAYKIKHANILLMADAAGPNWTDKRIAEALGCHVNTPHNVRQRYARGGLSAALARKVQEKPSREPILDGGKEAHLIALACSAPPEGRVRWTLHLLADRLVQMKVADSISQQTVWRVLKKTSSGRTCKSAGVFPPRRTGSS